MTDRHPLSPVPLRLVLALALALPLSLLLATPATAAVVISQVYGGGGNSGATYKNDFIELFNNGSDAISVSGWSVQYSSATGSSWGTTALPGLTLQPGQYLLVQQSAGTGGSTSLPTPDAIGTLSLSATAGKVALVSSTVALSGTAPTGGALKDIVSFGSTATGAETSQAPGLSNTTAALRALKGCQDSNDNSADFSAAAPAPRNSATTLAPCDGSTGTPATPPPSATAKPAEIYTIQGSGATSPLAGQLVITSGVVTKLASNGFYMQSLQGDGDPATSDGIYVYTGSAPTVAVGQLVQVTATVTEFATGGSTLTELTGPTAITLQGSGYSIDPTLVTLPVAGGLERYEGMLVSLSGPLTVNQNYFQARYGQLTLSAGGRLETPTNRYRAGSPQAIAMAADNAARRIVLDDGSAAQNIDPTPYVGPNGALRGGDTIASATRPIIGVIDYGPSTATGGAPGDYRILPLNPATLSYAITHPRSTAPDAVGGNVKVASFNVLNFFTTFTNGATASGSTGQGCSLGSVVSASNCRGADSLAEFNRQRAKIVEAMAAINADALGLMEIQNNGSVAAQNLVDALNAKVGSGTYAVVPDPGSGTGTDAIKVAMIYKPARLALLGAAQSDIDAVNNRPPLAQTFGLANGQKFTLVVNHLKSKGSCPSSGSGDTDAGDGQGCWNATRVSQANRLRSYVSQLQTSSGSNDVMLMGDFNSYGQEDPIIALTSNGYVDQIGRFNAFGYSYVFDGAAGRLDHAISSASLSAKVNKAIEWHINADEALAQDYNLEFKQPACAACAADPYTQTPYRSSDHDPVVMGLNLYDSVINATASVVTGSAGDDMIVSGAGRRTLTGGAGRDMFVFSAGFAGGATITDFTPGIDVISLSAVIKGLGITAASPIAQGYVGCTASGADALISIDPDAGGSAAARPMLLLKALSCQSVLNASNFVF